MTLSQIADIASLIGLPVTFWVLYETHLIRQHFSLRARIPELRTALAEQTKTLLSAIQSRNSGDAHESLAAITALLRNLEKKVGAAHKQTVTEAIQKIEAVTSQRLSDTRSLRGTYEATLGIVVTLEQVERDLAWK
ncbi:hypothetical protein [Pseudoxanthomonas sp. JBR18]|uniref:hypothetical protein n=1 Tax=Pseudoxanthomonas sp. JBR18 TaxID=2969308 RepID=UPI002306CB64|nr:hypothetical protein [Pseudoxanthomonas sp. JBR18]WCE04087.1 hypothetical protein PJ250_18755 [Pseudoxanthomonas sp. JBR18]